MELLDKALLRPGRFDRIIGVNVPDIEGRISILEIHTKNSPLANSVDEEVGKEMRRMSGAELKAVVTRPVCLLFLKIRKICQKMI